MFISALDLTGEVMVDQLRGEGEYLARCPIGYDDIEDTVYSAVVALSPLIGYADLPGYELVFNVVAADIHGREIQAYWDGAETKGFLSDASLRQRVRALICMMVGLLIDDASPALVSMTTHEAGLPPNALTKYHEICAIFRERGFRAGKADSWHGQHIWMMERN